MQSAFQVYNNVQGKKNKKKSLLKTEKTRIDESLVKEELKLIQKLTKKANDRQAASTTNGSEQISKKERKRKLNKLNELRPEKSRSPKEESAKNGAKKRRLALEQQEAKPTKSEDVFQAVENRNLDGSTKKKSKKTGSQNPKSETEDFSAKISEHNEARSQKSPQKRSKNSSREMSSVDAGKERLAWMIHPVAPEKFMKFAWEKQHLLASRKQSNYFKSLFSTRAFDSILRQKHVVFGRNLDVTSYENGVRETHNPEGRAYAPVVWDYYNNGCSLRLLNPQTFWEPVWQLCATLQEYFCSMVGANVYLTPPGTQGFAPHYDDVDVFILQLEGKKRWRLYKLESEQDKLPRFSSQNFSQDEIGTPFLDVVLEAGDTLYLPRGTVHQAMCLEDVHSLHITVSCNQLNTWGDLLLKLVPTALQAAMEESTEFREGLPVNYLSYMGACNSDSESDGRKTFMKTVERLMSKLFQFAPVDAAADQMSRKFVRDSLPPYLTESELSCCVEGDGERWEAGESRVVNRVEIDPDTEIRLVRANALRMMAEDDKNETAAQDDDEGPSIVIYFSSDNSREYHGHDEQSYRLPDPSLAGLVEHLIKAYPNYIRAEDLEADEEVELETKMGLVQALWERKIIVTRQSLESTFED